MIGLKRKSLTKCEKNYRRCLPISGGQRNNDGEWGELSIDIEAGTTGIMQFTD